MNTQAEATAINFFVMSAPVALGNATILSAATMAARTTLRIVGVFSKRRFRIRARTGVYVCQPKTPREDFTSADARQTFASLHEFRCAPTLEYARYLRLVALAASRRLSSGYRSLRSVGKRQVYKLAHRGCAGRSIA